MTTQPTNSLMIHEAMADTHQRELVQKMLAELLITVSDKLFANQEVYVDGYRFINCSFENCTLRILRGTFEFHHCTWKTGDGGKRIFGEGAQKCIQFYVFKNPKLAVVDGFNPKIHPDGSFSIAKGASM